MNAPSDDPARAPESDERAGAPEPALGLFSGNRVLRLARYTVPLHFFLPVVLWQIAVHWPEWLMGVLVSLHLFFAVAIACTYSWWRGNGEQLGALILLDHASSLLGALALATLIS